MANQDRVNFVWAESALTTIPPIPVSEVAYRDTTQTPEQMEVGQQYDTVYNSARHNQLLFLLTSVAKTLCENGIMPFLAGQEYSQYARCIFTDGKLYIASRAILANEQPYPTPGDDSGVWREEGPSKNLVPNSRRVIAGTGLTGGGPLSSDVTLAAKLTNSVSLTDSTTAASATAVKTAYDRGTAGVTAAGKAKTTAENALAVANTKQPNLGFTPVQQGGGTGQEPDHKVYLGWNSEGLAVQVDSLNLGNIITTKAGKQLAPAAELANKLAVGPSIYASWLYESIAGQPSYLWGSNDGVNMRVYNPANLSVNYANSAGQTQLAAPAVQWVVNTSGPAITVPPGGTYNVVCIVFNSSGGKGAVKYYPGTAGGTVISNASTDYFVAGLCARVA